jgi:alkaline phosphatase D
VWRTSIPPTGIEAYPDGVIRLGLAGLACLVATQAVAATPAAVAPLMVASGDVTATSAVLWARLPASPVRFLWSASPRFRRAGSRVVRAGADSTAHVRVRGLRAGRRYYFTATAGGVGVSGSFRTAPRSAVRAPVRLVIGGDVGGQRFCRNATDGGYRIFRAIDRLRPDVFVVNGDLVYLDGDCPAAARPEWPNIEGGFPNVIDVDWTNVPALRQAVLAHWRYNRADPFLQRFLRRTPIVAQWDDHEVINDFGARWKYWNSANLGRPGYPNLVAEGRRAFLAYSPIAGRRIYRSFRYGRHVQLFALDARSYRSRNDVPDGPAKTLLGTAQLRWLERGLARSPATWKIVSTDVPLSIPTGTNPGVFGYDSWVGFRRERDALFRFLDRRNVRNVVFVVTDVHFAQTIRYSVDADRDGDRLRFHELVNGPLAAIRLSPVALDPSAGGTSLYAEGGIFNFGYLRVSRRGRLTYDVRDIDGKPRPGSRLVLAPRS